jgi:hypothetical protein
MTHDIFISYSRRDTEIADSIERELSTHGISCFVDRSGINLGEDFAEIISKAIFECKIMLFVWSENSNQSENTANEIALAIEFGKTIVPFKIGNFQPHYKLAYRLVRYNRIDALMFNHSRIVELAAQLARQLGVKVQPESRTTAPRAETVETATTTSAPTLEHVPAAAPQRIDYPSGEYYIGEVKGGKKHGQGEYHYSDGEWYKGEFRDDELNGQGEYHSSDGDWFKGEFKDGVLNGQGEYYDSDGGWYKGAFKDFKFNGQGELHSSDGGWYKGAFRDGDFNGQGEYHYSDGDWIKGEFRDGKLNGQGEYHDSDGHWCKGEFKDNEFTASVSAPSPEDDVPADPVSIVQERKSRKPRKKKEEAITQEEKRQPEDDEENQKPEPVVETKSTDFESGVKYFEDKNYSKAMECFMAAAAQGDCDVARESASFIGFLYHYGAEGIKKDGRKSLEWYMKAVEQGHIDSMFEIGELYHYGAEGIKKDKKKAVEWYMKAAGQGHIDAMFEIGKTYDGFWSTTDSKVAEWYLKAAENGHVEAMYKIGHIYELGFNDQKKDMDKAMEWYLKAAEKGHVGATNQIWLIYDNKKDKVKAEEWWEKYIEARNAAKENRKTK